VLGPRAGDYYVVKQGLAEGEQVVVKGNFLIDSSLQIQAKPSMMSPEGGVPPAMPAMPGMSETPSAPTPPMPGMPGMQMPVPDVQPNVVPGKKP
jgi:Cu(I)/Ag(I) efflux system membrane fusion protein